MRNRPFEKGDLVTGATIYRPNVKTTAIVKKVSLFEDGSQSVFFKTCHGLPLNDDEFIVKHIRKPRKGGEEARDICAMLQCKMLKVRRDARRYCIERGRKRTFKETLQYHDKTALLYEGVVLAKSMLK